MKIYSAHLVYLPLFFPCIGAYGGSNYKEENFSDSMEEGLSSIKKRGVSEVGETRKG